MSYVTCLPCNYPNKRRLTGACHVAHSYQNSFLLALTSNFGSRLATSTLGSTAAMLAGVCCAFRFTPLEWRGSFDFIGFAA